MISFILISSPLVFVLGFLGTAFIRTNFFSPWKKKSNRTREKLLTLFSSYCIWLLFFLFISNKVLHSLGVTLGIDAQVSNKLSWGLNLRPFRTISTYRHHVSGLHYFTNVWGNILITIPLGFFAPILWKKLDNPKTLFPWAFFTFLLVEGIQYFIGRSADIDDVILNLLGILLGFLLKKPFQNFFPKRIFQR